MTATFIAVRPIRTALAFIAETLPVRHGVKLVGLGSPTASTSQPTSPKPPTQVTLPGGSKRSPKNIKDIRWNAANAGHQTYRRFGKGGDPVVHPIWRYSI